MGPVAWALADMAVVYAAVGAFFMAFFFIGFFMESVFMALVDMAPADMAPVAGIGLSWAKAAPAKAVAMVRAPSAVRDLLRIISGLPFL